MIGQVHIWPQSIPGGDLILELGEDVPHFSKGLAEWKEIRRPRRRNYLEFDGESLGKLTLDVMLQRPEEDGEVDSIVEHIMGWSARLDLPFQPTLLKIDGPIPYPWLTYVLTGVDDSGVVERNRPDGLRTRQQLKLEFTEYNAPDLIIQKPPAQAAQERAQVGLEVSVIQSVGKAAAKTYTVKSGDTLSGIAASQLGKASRWPEVANLNGVRDPKKLAIGQVLKLP